MARPLSNTNIITDSWEVFILQHNELMYAHSTETITANSTYANTGNTTFSRHAQLYGKFGSNTIAVTEELRGGNINSGFANLNITTNTNIGNTSAANINLLVSNSSIQSYLNPVGVYLGNTSANTYANTTAIVTQTGATVNTVITPVSILVSNSTTNSTITSNSFSTGITKVNRLSVDVGSNVTVNSTALAVSNTIVKEGELRVGNSSVNTVYTDTEVTISSGARSSEINLTGYSFDSIVKMETKANNNIGTSIVAPIKIFDFPKASFSTGEFTVQVKGGVYTQVSKMLLSHNGTDSRITVYGSVSTPESANNVSPVGNFSTAVNGANVDIYFKQNIASSSVKVVANLTT